MLYSTFLLWGSDKNIPWRSHSLFESINPTMPTSLLIHRDKAFDRLYIKTKNNIKYIMAYWLPQYIGPTNIIHTCSLQTLSLNQTFDIAIFTICPIKLLGSKWILYFFILTICLWKLCSNPPAPTQTQSHVHWQFHIEIMKPQFLLHVFLAIPIYHNDCCYDYFNLCKTLLLTYWFFLWSNILGIFPCFTLLPCLLICN